VRLVASSASAAQKSRENAKREAAAAAMTSLPTPTTAAAVTSSAKAELQHLLSTPVPSTTTNSHHATAHNPAMIANAALERLRDSGDEQFLFLRTLLELLQQRQAQTALGNRNDDDMLLWFHCITGCRHVVLHGWRRFAPAFGGALRDWMMLLGHYVFSDNTVTNKRTLQMSCYTTSVALWKRAWLEQQQQQQQHAVVASIENPQQQSLVQAMQQSLQTLPLQHQHHSLPLLQTPTALFQYLEQSILDTPTNNANNPLQLPSTRYLQALVEEFAGTKSAVTYQLPLEFHRQTRQAFESTKIATQGGSATASTSPLGGLHSCLKLTMKTLSQILPTLTTPNTNHNLLAVAQGMMQCAVDILTWEFGGDAFVATSTTTTKTLVRPPALWKEWHVTTPALAQTLWHVHRTLVQQQQQQQCAHTVRQFLLTLASLEGPIFTLPQERRDFLAAILQGTLELLQVQVTTILPQEDIDETKWTEILDTLSILTRLVTNGKWALLIQLFHSQSQQPQQDSSLLPGLLQGLKAIGTTLWQQQVANAVALQGDLESMEHGDIRQELLNQLLESVVAVSGDSWLYYSSENNNNKQWARQLIASRLGPLYGIWIHGRLQLAGWEEHYLCHKQQQHNDHDILEEEYEHISAVQLQEEMDALSTLGRIHIQGAIQSLSELFQQTIPQLQAQWNSTAAAAGTEAVDVVSPAVAALLEQARLLTLYIGHLLTDDNSGETPVIPDAVVIACREEGGGGGTDSTAIVIPSIVSAMEALFSLAQSHAVKLAAQPEDPRLSPLLANSFLWCLNRWAPAYVYSVDYNATTNSESKSNNNIGSVWSTPEKAQQAISFCVTLCLHFQCYWPQERPVQESATALLLSLAKRATGDQPGCAARPSLRSLMVASPAFIQMMQFHCFTAGTRHSMPLAELQSTIHNHATRANCSVDMTMVTGYQRLPYDIRSKILTVILVACSEPATEHLWNDCVKAVQDAFTALLHALSTKQVTTSDMNAKEMTCLCVEMFRGVARASEMAQPSRVPVFLTPHLQHLSGLMTHYAEDLTICERLLQFFHDYAEQFVIMLNREQCLALFQACAELLKSYSQHHCNSKTRRVVINRPSTTAGEQQQHDQSTHSLEEEQTYNDILCAISLLIHLGTKDFIDICADDSNSSTTTTPGVDSAQVTDVIFFGLQQILPLMTQGLLQLPTLCTQYFSLVGFMMDTYPEKIAVLPYELLDALFESLLFGMGHHDPIVAKSSLQGIASITREQIQNQSLNAHLSRKPDFFDQCSSRLLRDVIFQNRVWDRIESAGLALLPLAAVNVNRFAAVVGDLTNQIPVAEQRVRLQSGFQSLLQPEVIHKVASGGLEGRKNRIRFKKDFENFVHDIHSFLILK
jgi:hypothetical protein